MTCWLLAKRARTKDERAALLERYSAVVEKVGEKIALKQLHRKIRPKDVVIIALPKTLCSCQQKELLNVAEVMALLLPSNEIFLKLRD